MFSSTHRSCQFWYPLIFPSKEVWIYFPRDEAAGVWIWPLISIYCWDYACMEPYLSSLMLHGTVFNSAHVQLDLIHIFRWHGCKSENNKCFVCMKVISSPRQGPSCVLVHDTVSRWMIRRWINDELERILKGNFCGLVEVRSLNFSGAADKNQEKPKSSGVLDENRTENLPHMSVEVSSIATNQLDFYVIKHLPDDMERSTSWWNAFCYN
jgi:hypothetical protein